jgi:hypothetical protein
MGAKCVLSLNFGGTQEPLKRAAMRRAGVKYRMRRKRELDEVGFKDEILQRAQDRCRGTRN